MCYQALSLDQPWPERNFVFTEVKGVNHQAACEEELEVTSAWMLAVCFLGPLGN